MADHAFTSGSPYSLVTTVIQNRFGGFKFAELSLHLASGSVRLRFSDRHSLNRFCAAVADLAHDIQNPAYARPVRTRLYTDPRQALATPPEPTVRPSARPLLIDDSFGLPS